MYRVLLLFPLLALGACYYTQAVSGQLDVLGKREPIERVLADAATPDDVAARLRLVQDARRYSVDVLGLPENGSYQTYVDLERDYVVWNVFAAGEFTLQAKRWCYPIVGCVAYRGYFKQAKAERLARQLADDGYDVYVGGVAAYSTLGKFNDPVLSTMMRWDDVQLVGVLFHELAHQKLYIKDDTGFNESFASAVEEIGVERYLADRDMQDAFSNYKERKRFRRESMRILAAARDDLRTYYNETIDADEKRLLKEHRIERLAADLRTQFEKSGRDPSSWLSSPFNNARLASLALYEGRLPAFRHMYADCGEQLPCFYAEALRVSGLDQTARDDYFDALVTR